MNSIEIHRENKTKRVATSVSFQKTEQNILEKSIKIGADGF